MEESTSREKVLKKIREALLHKTDNPFKHFDIDTPVYTKSHEIMDVNFAEVFNSLGGVFIYCESEVELTAALAGLIKECNWDKMICKHPAIQFILNSISATYTDDDSIIDSSFVTITNCKYLLSQTGSIVLSSEYGTKIFSIPDTLVVVAYTNQLAESLTQMFSEISQNKSFDNSQLTIITGTGSINPTGNTFINQGVAPNNLFLILVEANH